MTPSPSQPATAAALSLPELRRAHHLSQQQLAQATATTQPAVLKTENAADPYLSTIRRYVEGIGTATGTDATLELVAVIDGRRHMITTDCKGTTMPTTTDHATDHTTGRATIGHRGATGTTMTPTAWRLRAWDDAALEDRFRAEKVIAMSKDEIGDLTRWPDDDELRHRLREGTEGHGEQAIGMFVRYWDYFRNQMQPGDPVTVPLVGKRAAIGVIESGYVYRPADVEDNARMRHIRNVRWTRTVDRGALPEEIRKVVNAPGTICRIKAPGAAEWLLGA